MKVQLLDGFRRDFHLLPEGIQKRVRKALALLEENPFHPSLHTKKIRGKQGVWEARVTIAYRVTFSWEGDLITLRRVGTHNILRRETR